MDTPSLKNKYMSLVSVMKRSVDVTMEHRSSSSMMERKKFMRKISKSEDIDEMKNKLIYLTRGKCVEVDLFKELDDPNNYPIQNEIAKILKMKEDIKTITKYFEGLTG
jgi:hypothetical protein